MKADSLGISPKIHLKVDVEMGKLIIKRAKDGPEDKFYNQKKSKMPRVPNEGLNSGPMEARGSQ